MDESSHVFGSLIDILKRPRGTPTNPSDTPDAKRGTYDELQPACANKLKPSVMWMCGRFMDHSVHPSHTTGAAVRPLFSQVRTDRSSSSRTGAAAGVRSGFQEETEDQQAVGRVSSYPAGVSRGLIDSRTPEIEPADEQQGQPPWRCLLGRHP